MARKDLQQKYAAKRMKLPAEKEIWGVEGARKVRLVQEHAVYGGMVEAMDQAVGKVLDALERLGLTSSTAVFFMSDNGGLSTSEGHPTSNLPLRAGKGWMYEGGIREPMIVRAPGVTRAGSKSDAVVTSTDFYPTILELAGLPAEPEHHVDGKSFVAVLKGKPFSRGPVYWHYPHYGNQGGAPAGAIRDGKWKLIEWYEDGKLELFDLESDIGETDSLSPRHPDVREVMDRLHAKLKAWRQETKAVMPKTNPQQ